VSICESDRKSSSSTDLGEHCSQADRNSSSGSIGEDLCISNESVAARARSSGLIFYRCMDRMESIGAARTTSGAVANTTRSDAAHAYNVVKTEVQ